jgi:hypothetical protein
MEWATSPGAPNTTGAAIVALGQVVVGAVLASGVATTVQGIDVAAVGRILVVVGVLGLLALGIARRRAA